MPIRSVMICALSISLCLLSACASAPARQGPPENAAAAASTYFTEKVHEVGEGVYIGPQMDETDIPALREKGITHVINFRTPKEMAGLDFDEPGALAEAGIGYTPIPIGGEAYPYTPASLDQMSRAMRAQKGGVLLHCRSGGRASVVTVAWLVREQGMPLNQALEHARGWWPLSLEKVMGTSFTLVEE